MSKRDNTIKIKLQTPIVSNHEYQDLTTWLKKQHLYFVFSMTLELDVTTFSASAFCGFETQTNRI
jgi:hypothetical protein